MINLLAILATGFFLGMRHATDPDHVVAVTTILARKRDLRSASMLGFCWGLGHTVTIFVVGCAIILLGLVIPPRVGLGLELSVGLMLIVLGGANILSFYRLVRNAGAKAEHSSAQVHSHAHSHGDYVHDHPHSHAPEAHPHRADQTPVARLDAKLGGVSLYRHVRPLLIGVVHGLAGSAAVALLILTIIPNPQWAMAYLLFFGMGTIAGMMLITMSLASAFHFAGKHNLAFSRWLGFASGVASVAFGLFMAFRIVFTSNF